MPEKSDIDRHQNYSNRHSQNDDKSRSLQFLEQVLSKLETGVSMITPDKRISWVNDKIRHMFPHADPIGQICHIFFDTSEEPCDPCLAEHCFKTGEECRRDRYSPLYERWFEITCKPIEGISGEIVQVFESINDITDRKTVEINLRQGRDRDRKIFDEIPDPVFIEEVNPDGTPGKFIDVNESARKMLGYSRQEFQELTPYSLDDCDVSTDITNILHTKKLCIFETIQIAKDGKRIPVENYTRLININNKKFFLTVSRKMTERKKAHDRVRKNVKIIPVCSYCNKIRDENDNWVKWENYFMKYFFISTSHGMCFDCYEKNLPELME